MVIVGMSVVATVIVLQFHHHNTNNGQMPRWVGLISFYLIGKRSGVGIEFSSVVSLTNRIIKIPKNHKSPV